MTCDKATYATAKRAHAAAKRLTSSTNETFRGYMCDLCRKWHVTSSEKLQHPGGSRSRPPSRTPRAQRGRRPTNGQTLEELAKQMRGERSTGD